MAIFTICLLIFCIRNRKSLQEGLRYLNDMRKWNPHDGKRIRQNGRYASCHDLVGLNNAQRYAYLHAKLLGLGMPVQEIPIPGERLPNLFVRFGPATSVTLLVAHYDISREDAAYQGASDNTTAVAVLLAALDEWAYTPPNKSVGVLFTAAEERGMLGAKAFVAYSRLHGLQIADVLNFDMLGRDALAIRPSALPGFYIELPLIGLCVYDGRQFRRGTQFVQPDPRLVQQLQAIMGTDLVIYKRFTARSDSNIFQEAGIPTVSISSANMYYLDLVWERDTDRIELLDEHNLDLALELIRKWVR